MSIFKELDFKILVTCDDDIRMERVIKRDGISKEYFLLRDKNSLSYDESLFDVCIDNCEKKDTKLIFESSKV
jgi:dephospho-CoA kinase